MLTAEKCFSTLLSYIANKWGDSIKWDGWNIRKNI